MNADPIADVFMIVVKNDHVFKLKGRATQVTVDVRAICNNSAETISRIIYPSSMYFVVITNNNIIKFNCEALQLRENGANASNRVFLRTEWILPLKCCGYVNVIDSLGRLYTDKYVVGLDNGEILE